MLYGQGCQAVQANLFNSQIHYPTLMNGGELVDGILHWHKQNMSFWQNLFQYELNMLEKQTVFILKIDSIAAPPMLAINPVQ